MCDHIFYFVYQNLAYHLILSWYLTLFYSKLLTDSREDFRFLEDKMPLPTLTPCYCVQDTWQFTIKTLAQSLWMRQATRDSIGCSRTFGEGLEVKPIANFQWFDSHAYVMKFSSKTNGIGFGDVWGWRFGTGGVLGEGMEAPRPFFLSCPVHLSHPAVPELYPLIRNG